MNGSAADAGDNSVCQTDSDMISDFESSPGKATLDSQSGLTGYWYVFFPDSDTSSTLSDGEAISPALVDRNPITSIPHRGLGPTPAISSRCTVPPKAFRRWVSDSALSSAPSALPLAIVMT